MAKHRPVVLCIQDLTKVVDVLKKHHFAVTNSYQLGLSLGLGKHTLDVIEKDHKGDTNRCLLEFLSAWLRQADNVKDTGGPTWYALINALHSIGENSVAEGVDKDKHPACVILAEHHSQSIQDALPSLAFTLHYEGLTDDLLPHDIWAAVQQAVCNDYRNLQKFADIVRKLINVLAGKAILFEYEKTFLAETKDVKGEVRIRIPFGLCKSEEFDAIITKFDDTIHDVKNVLAIPPPANVDDLKSYLNSSRYYRHLKSELSQCENMEDIFQLVIENSSLFDIRLLEVVVNKFRKDDAITLVQQYKEIMKNFRSSSQISLFINEHLSSSAVLLCETAKFIVDKSVDEVTFDDIEILVKLAFDGEARIVVIKEENSFSVTCSFALILSQSLIDNALKNMELLKAKGVIKLTVGYCTVYEATQIEDGNEEKPMMSSVYACKGGMEQLMVSQSVTIQLLEKENKIGLIKEIKQLTSAIAIDKDKIKLMEEHLMLDNRGQEIELFDQICMGNLNEEKELVTSRTNTPPVLESTVDITHEPFGYETQPSLEDGTQESLLYPNVENSNPSPTFNDCSIRRFTHNIAIEKHSPSNRSISGKQTMYQLSQDSSIPQGYCIIINNNKSYYGEEKVMEIRKAFRRQLGFHVQMYTDCTRKGIKHLLTTIASTDHTHFHCMIVIVLSKGGRERVIYGSDGKKLSLKDLVMLFSRDASPSLVDKPKLFFIDGQLDDNEKHSRTSEDLEIHIPNTCLVGHFEQSTEDRNFVFEMFSLLHKGVAFDDEMKNFLKKVTYVNNLTKQLHFLTITARDNLLNKGHHLIEQIKMSLKVLLKLRDVSIKECEEKRGEIIQLCQNIRRTRVAGGVTSLIGGAITIVGFALIPATLGGSLAISGIGAAVGMTGGALSIGSIVTDKVVSNKKIKKFQATLEIDRQLTEQFNDLLEKLDDVIQTIERENTHGKREDVFALLFGGSHVARIGTVVTKTGISGGQLTRIALQGTAFTVRVVGSAARGVAIAGGVVTALTIPLDIYEIASNSIKLHKKSESDETKTFNEKLETLQNEREQIQQMMYNLTPQPMPLEPSIS